MYTGRPTNGTNWTKVIMAVLALATGSGIGGIGYMRANAVPPPPPAVAAPVAPVESTAIVLIKFRLDAIDGRLDKLDKRGEEQRDLLKSIDAKLQ